MSCALVFTGACKVPNPDPIQDSFADDFSRKGIGPDYFKSGGNYRIDEGVLRVQGAKNHPLWLRKSLPSNVEIELDVWSNSPDGDIKLELFGDGETFDRDGGAYKASGYVLVFGGWNNTKSILAKQDEHGKELVSRTRPRVTVGQKYHYRIRREDAKVTWYIDNMDEPFLEYTDPKPLKGEKHAYFAFSNWNSDSYFDNLEIRSLDK